MHDAASGAAAVRARTALIAAAILALAAVAALFPARSGAAGSRDSASSAVVKTAKNAALGKTILVNRRGLTLYHLSAEKNGKFICTDTTCLSLWHPLVVPRGTTPSGARFLATVKRPDGRVQVTYRGGPLYTFAEDRKPGDAKGDGFKDVGVWHPATPSGSGSTSSSGGGGGYGGGYGR
jgi:predicted lipoprotein with Yx(FWY)xxD motif